MRHLETCLLTIAGLLTLTFPGKILAGDVCKNAFINTPWTVEFSDGSANAYQFRQTEKKGATQFEYTPVGPENSSTGMYSGGSARSGAVNEHKVKRLCKRIAKLENNPKLLGGARGKGTGVFKITTPSGIRTFVIESSKQLRRFEKYLASIR